MRRLIVLIILSLIAISILGSVSPIQSLAADEPHAGRSCRPDDRGERRVVLDDVSAGESGKFQVSVRADQLRCNCTRKETIPLPDGTTQEECVDYEWESERLSGSMPSTDTALDEVRLHRYTTNAHYGRICPSPWHGSRGHDDRDPDHSQPWQADEEYSVNLAFWWKGDVELEERRPFCEPDSARSIKTVINGVKGPDNYAIRYEAAFDIQAAVQAAVAALPFDQMRIGASPPGVGGTANPTDRGLAGLESYFWHEGLDQAPWGGFMVSTPGHRGRAIRAWVTAQPGDSAWSFGDGATLPTDRRGLPWPRAELAPDAPHPQAIAHVFGAAGAYTIVTQREWRGRWGLFEDGAGASCGPGTPCPRSIPLYTTAPVVAVHTRPYVVGQAQAVGIATTPIPRP